MLTNYINYVDIIIYYINLIYYKSEYNFTLDKILGFLLFFSEFIDTL